MTNRTKAINKLGNLLWEAQHNDPSSEAISEFVNLIIDAAKEEEIKDKNDFLRFCGGS